MTTNAQTREYFFDFLSDKVAAMTKEELRAFICDGLGDVLLERVTGVSAVDRGGMECDPMDDVDKHVEGWEQQLHDYIGQTYDEAA